MLDANTELLSVEECNAVDAALLTSHGKFNARVAIYALRSLKQIAENSGEAIDNIQPDAISQWIEADPNLQENVDANFRTFWTRLVLSASQPLKQAASQAGVPLQDLTVPQVIQWFEAEAKNEIPS